MRMGFLLTSAQVFNVEVRMGVSRQAKARRFALEIQPVTLYLLGINKTLALLQHMMLVRAR
jgi:hypothetical protein